MARPALARPARHVPLVGTQLNPLLAPPIRPFELSDDVDLHDLLVQEALRLGFNYLLGSAFKLIAEAQACEGAERREKVEEAIRYLQQQRVQAGDE